MISFKISHRALQPGVQGSQIYPFRVVTLISPMRRRLTNSLMMLCVYILYVKSYDVRKYKSFHLKLSVFRLIFRCHFTHNILHFLDSTSTCLFFAVALLCPVTKIAMLY